jgi:mycothiol synthase
VVDVIGVARLAEAADGVAPLDEATLLALKHHPDRVRTWGDHRGFGLLVDDQELAVVVAPHERGAGLGKRLLRQHPLPEAVTAWSHGDHPAAARLAKRHGFARVRELWVMRLDVSGADAARWDPTSVPGVELRPYEPAWQDELLRVNAAAFAHHPEQGSLDAIGLAERMAEPWWDPAGLILAVEGGTLLGFHWTKQHSADLGEVYVVGVDPAAQGRGLGKVVTAAGLAHLARLGVAQIHLYVEADNTPAVGLYRGLGFTHDRSDSHVQYARG